MDNDAVEGRPSKRLKTSPEPAQVQSETSVPKVSIPEAPIAFNVEASSSITDHVIEKEHKVGITVFVGEAKTTLRGLAKKRYADFLVNEILPGGRVLHLENMKAEREGGRGGGEAEDEKERDVKKEKEEEAVVSNGKSSKDDAEKPEERQAPCPTQSRDAELNETPVTVASTQDATDPGTISDSDKATLISNLNATAVTELLALYAAILSNPKKKAKEHPIVRTDFTSDRTLRAHVHQEIRRIFSSKIESSTTHDGVLVLQAAIPRNDSRSNHNKNNSKIGTNAGQGGGRLTYAERGGEYTHFTLYKENKDTMETISLLARFLKLNTKELSFAGTKDRRAVTAQRVSVRRVDAQRLAALNRTLRMCAVGDFVYKEKEVGLGGLEGNEFCVTVRECDVQIHGSERDGAVGVEEKINLLKNHLTTALQQLHTTGFLNYFGLQRFGTFATRSDAIGLKLLRGDFEAACNAILEYQESAIADPVTQTNCHPAVPVSQVGREDRARAEAISHFRRTNNVNESLGMMPRRFSAETAVIRHLGRSPKDFLGAILGIQHGMRSMYVHAYQSMVWNKAVSERWRLFGGRVVEGDLVLVREHWDKQGRIEEEDVDGDGEIIVKAEGEDRARVADEVFERARVLTKEEVEGGKYTIRDVVMPQPGFDVLYPANASGEFYKSFMGTEEGGGLDPHEMKRKQRDFSLPGAYRKMLARIGREWKVDVRRYEGDEEQFVVTDLERIRAELEGKGERGNGQMEGSKIAAVLKFQLGTSQYATMALRELSGGGVREYKPEFSGGR